MTTNPWDEPGYDPTEGGTLCGKKKTGNSQRGGNPSPWCTQPAGYGVPGVHVGPCKHHGGKAPHVAAANLARQQQADAEAAVATFGLPIDIGPHEALLEELHRTAGAVAYLGQIVRRLDEAGLKQKTKDRGGLTWEKPAVWVELYQQERSHLVAVGKACHQAGIDERRIELAEAQGELLARVISAVFDDPELELTSGQRRLAPTLVRRHLSLVQGEGSAA